MLRWSADALNSRKTVEQRAQEISARLLLLLNRPMNPETLALDVSQWSVGREFRLRVQRAMGENGIEIGAPQQTYSIESPLASSLSMF